MAAAIAILVVFVAAVGVVPAAAAGPVSFDEELTRFEPRLDPQVPLEVPKGCVLRRGTHGELYLGCPAEVVRNMIAACQAEAASRCVPLSPETGEITGDSLYYRFHRFPDGGIAVVYLLSSISGGGVPGRGR